MILIAIMAGAFLYFLSTIPSNEQVARLNTELLRSKIHEACIKERAELEGFSFPQVRPAKIIVVNALAAYRIKGLGDPDFLLYYEAFPIGEGLGWEVYQGNSIGHRVFAPFTADSEGLKDATNFERQLYAGQNSRYETVLKSIAEGKLQLQREKISVVIPNIMLSDYVNIMPTSEAKPVLPTIGKVEYKKGNAGEWIYHNPLGQPDVFRLDLSMSNEQKSFIKYRPCGVRSLCLKTPEAVTRIPLSSACGDIQYVHLNYVASDARKLQTAGFLVATTAGTAAVGVAIVKAGGIAALGTVLEKTIVGKVVLKSAGFLKFIFKYLGKIPFIDAIFGAAVTNIAYRGLREFSGLIVTAFAGVKTSDFYIASPCNIDKTILIEKKDCSALKGSGPDKCERWLKYPIYNVFVDDSGKKVQEVGTHYQCVEGLGPAGKNDVKPDDAPTGKCLQITIQDPPEGFCWTKNAYREQWRSWFYNDISWELDLTVVVDNTEFLDKNTIHVKPITKTPFSPSSVKEILGFEWKWPG